MLINTATSTLPFAPTAAPTAREARSAEVAEILSQHRTRRAELGASDLANYRSYAGGMAADIESTSAFEVDMHKMQRDMAEANKRQMESRNPGNPYAGIAENSTTVTVDAWKKGENDCIERILRNQGYSLQEIYAKDKDGKTLIDRVVEANGLKSPKHLQPGQTLQVPTRRPQSPGSEEFGRQEAQGEVGPARRETQPSREADGPSQGRGPANEAVPPEPAAPSPTEPKTPESQPVSSSEQVRTERSLDTPTRARAIFDALEGGRVEGLSSLLLDLSNQQIGEIKALYPEVTGKRWTLEQHVQLRLCTKPLLLKTVLSILEGNRMETQSQEDINSPTVVSDAQSLHSSYAGSGDPQHLVRVLTKSTPEHIRLVNDRLHNNHDKLTLWMIIEKATSGLFQGALGGDDARKMLEALHNRAIR